MTTDSWEQVKAALLKLWHRRYPEQTQAVGTDLAEARSGMVAARDVGDEQVEADLLAEWRSRLRRLAVDDEQVQDELRRFTEVFRHLLSEPREASQVVMRAKAYDSARINQAGHDQTVIGT